MEEEEEAKKKMDVKYLDIVCPLCLSRIDELGYCACGATSG